MVASHDSDARKRPVNLTLNADLVDRVRATTDNLSGVVEKLLADYLEQRRVVVPPVLTSEMGKLTYLAFNPAFSVSRIAVTLDPLDELFSRAWK